MRFRVFRLLFWRRMWLESFLCMKGLGTDSLGLKTLNDNPNKSMTWETGGLRKTNYFIYSSDNGDSVRDLIKM